MDWEKVHKLMEKIDIYRNEGGLYPPDPTALNLMRQVEEILFEIRSTLRGD